MLSIGQTGVRAYARALDTLADNVANAATPGHVRRTTILGAVNQGGGKAPLELDPGGGAGVRLLAIGRAADQLQLDSLRRAEGSVAALDASTRWLAEVEAALTGPNGLEAPLNALFGSLSDLAGDPANPALRETFLARADALADQFNRSAIDLQRLGTDLAAEAGIEVDTLNNLSQSLADINGRLRRASAGSAAAAALADARDRTLAQMASITSIDVALDPLGQAVVRVPDGGGPLLVAGSDAVSARLLQGGAGLELRLGPSGADQPAPLMGGVLAGLSAAHTLLAEAQQRLDALADRIAGDFNQLHQQGVDLAGTDGGPLFATVAPEVVAARGTGGSARVSARLADGATLHPMSLSFDGAQWTLARDDGGGSVSGPLPLTLDGLSAEAEGAPRAGDLFRIGPSGPAAGLRLRPLSGDQLALAARWVSEPAATNGGSGMPELRTGPALTPPAAPPFTLVASGGALTLQDSLGTPLATGLPGEWIAGDGFAVRLSGAPALGDSFAIQRTGAQSGGNGNALALLALRDSTAPGGSPGEQADALVSRIAVATAASRARLDVATEARNEAAEALSESSGVDLDTEAAEMLRLQQAYNANARVLQAAREIFETLLQSSQ